MMAMSGATDTGRVFRLLPWFAGLSLACVGVFSAATAYVVSRFIAEHLIERDAVVSMEFIQSVSHINDPRTYFQAANAKAAAHDQLQEFFEHVIRLPDVLRANAYATDRTIIWSDERDLIGRRLGENEELDAALGGKLVYERKHMEDEHGAHGKMEHHLLPPGTNDFLENYIPIWDASMREVVGVVELYKHPTALFVALREGERLVWTNALVGGLFLYLALFWIVRRGSIVIDRQQRALVDAERFAAIGGMVGAVAHSIRNPIASVRSSAELAIMEANESVREYLRDIIAEVDRFDTWIRELLSFSRDMSDRNHTTPVAYVIANSLSNFGDRLDKQGVRVMLDISDSLPDVKGEAHVLSKVFNSLIANALEAMPSGGELSLCAMKTGKSIQVLVRDNGIGIPKERLTKVFDPLVSWKVNGLGVGLALARRVLEGYGGRIELDSDEGVGTTARVTLPVAVA